MTKQELNAENMQLRALLAQTVADHKAEVAVLNRKLFALNSERSKWQHRAQQQQHTPSNFVERCCAAREEAMRTGRCVAIRGV